MFIQDDLDTTTLDVGKLSEVPEITKVLIYFSNSIIAMANIYREQTFVSKLNFLCTIDHWYLKIN